MKLLATQSLTFSVSCIMIIICFFLNIASNPKTRITFKGMIISDGKSQILDCDALDNQSECHSWKSIICIGLTMLALNTSALIVTLARNTAFHDELLKYKSAVRVMILSVGFLSCVAGVIANIWLYTQIDQLTPCPATSLLILLSGFTAATASAFELLDKRTHISQTLLPK